MKTGLTILFLGFALNLSAQTEIKAWFVQELKAKNEHVHSLVSDFTQVQQMAFLDQNMTASGQFYFQKPGSIRWEQLDPSSYFLVINPTEALKFDGQKKQKLPFTSPVVTEFRKIIVGTMDGSLFDDQDYQSTFSKAQDRVLVEILPQRAAMKKRVSKIQMTFETTHLFLMELVFVSPDGDLRTIAFSNHQVNMIANPDLIFSTDE